MSKRKNTPKDSLIRLIISTISIFIMAVNYNLFFLRNNIVSGGVSGLATIINAILKIAPGITILVFNIALVVISFFTLGKRATGRTIIGSILYPVFVTLTAPWVVKLYSLTNFKEFILVVLVSGLIYGTFNGIIYKTGYSTGGMDTLILIVNKYFKISTGASSLIINLILIIIGAFTFGIEKAVYGIIIIVLNTVMINKIQLGISNAKMFYITTKKTEEVKEAIKSLGAGYTIMNTEGGHTHGRNHMIMCVVPTMSYYMFRKTIMDVDNEAFIIINDCYQVYGGHIKENFPFI